MTSIAHQTERATTIVDFMIAAYPRPSASRLRLRFRASCQRRLWPLLLLLLLCCAGQSAFAALEWWLNPEQPRPGTDVFLRGVAADASGVYVAGFAQGPPNFDSAGYVRKYDAAGNVVWTVWPLPDRRFEAIDVDPTGVYVAGTDGTARTGAVARLQPGTGRVLWNRLIDQPDGFTGIKLHSSGVYLGGYVRSVPDGTGRGTLTKLNRNGAPAWAAATNLESDTVLMHDTFAVHDSGIYVVGEQGISDVRKFDFDGRETARFGTGDETPYSQTKLTVDASGVYVALNSLPGPAHPVHRKYTHSGRRVWTLRDDNRNPYIRSMASGPSGYFAARYTRQQLPVGYYFTRYTPDGSPLATHRLAPQAVGAYWRYNSAAFVAQGTGIYAIGQQSDENGDYYKPFVTRMSQDHPPEAQVLRDINGNGRPEVAVLLHDSAASKVSALIKDAANGAVVSRMAFAPSYWPHQLLRLPDANGNGADELAVLGTHAGTGAVSAEVRDGRSGALLRRVDFDRRFRASKLVALPDLNGNGTPELALLEASLLNIEAAPAQVEVRDSVTGALIRRIAVPALAGHTTFDTAVIPGASAGRRNLAVLGFDSDYNVLATLDPSTGRQVAQTLFTYNFGSGDAVRVLSLPDGNGNGIAEIAVVGPESPYEDDLSAPGTVFEGAGSLEWLRNISNAGSDSTKTLQQMRRIDDINGNGYPELAFAWFGISNAQVMVMIVDGLTSERIIYPWFVDDAYAYRGLEISPDLNGNRSSELVILQQRRGDGQVRARIIDARTGRSLRSIVF